MVVGTKEMMFTQVWALSMEVKPYVLLLFILMMYQGTELIYLEIVRCGLSLGV